MTSQERRRRKRANLHWPVRLFRRDRQQPLECTTQNICSEGFNCIIGEPIPIGDSVECLLLIPGSNSGGECGVWLRCTAKVVHVDHVEAGNRFGVGMRILDYSLIPEGDQERDARGSGSASRR